MPRINAVSFHENPSIEAICQAARRAGYDSLELSRPPFYDKLTTPGLRRRFASWAADLGLHLYGFDCWVDVQPYDRLDETLADFRRAVDFAASLNLGMIISHDPWASVNGHRGAGECLKASVQLFGKVAAMCAERNLRLVLEPHPDTHSMDDAWACDLIDRLADGNAPGQVGILYDCCHYGVGRPDNYIGSIEKLGQRIGHVHFADGDRRTYALHLPTGDGELDLPGVVAALKEIGYQKTLTCDMFNYPLLEDGAQRCAGAIRQVEQQLGL